jgi:16S rRNA (guanine527-N7)-methyltransferase
MSDPTGRLTTVLDRAREVGFLGPGPVDRHVRHARGFALAYPGDVPPERTLDLGSGGGIPGLVLAVYWTSTEFVLLDAGERRASFLEHAVAELDLADRVRVVRGRAEDVGREASERGQFELVVARSFASPSVTAECSAPFLREGGHLIISEPPETGSTSERWPAAALAQLGFDAPQRVEREFGYLVVEQRELCPDRFPRRTGIPAKRPLF